MSQRILRIAKDGSLDLDGESVSLDELEAVLAEDKARGITAPFKVYAPVLADEKVMTAILEFSDKYRQSEIVMGNVS